MEEEGTSPPQISPYSSTTFFDDIAWAHRSPPADWNLFSGNGDPIFSNPPPASVSDEKSIPILHLLLAAAEALAGPDEQRELAGAILIRLKELLRRPESAAPIAERLAAHFADALQSILVKKGPTFRRPLAADELSAFQLMQGMSPCTNFGHFTANQAILDAVNGFRPIHIVDFDIDEGIQWASFMQALVSHKNGAFAPPSLRITAVVDRRSTAKTDKTGQNLAAFAASVNLPFSFSHCRLGRNQRFRPTAVRAVKGEAVILNCVLHSPQTPHRSTGSIKSFIGAAAAVGACLVTVVEEENGGGAAPPPPGFAGKFLNEMGRYWAMMEAMEEEFPEQGRAREVVEKKILAAIIAAAVRRAYCEEEEEGEEGVGEWMAAARFLRLDLSGFNVSQAWMLIKLFNNGYRVEEEGSNKLVLRWKSRRLVFAAAWSVPAAAAQGI